METQKYAEQHPYECRFLDPDFVQKWSRWQQARNLWRETWETLPLLTPPYFTDQDCPDHPVAKEFVDARREYLADLDRRLELERKLERV